MADRSIMKGIPVSELETVKSYLKNSGTKFRVVYRGPRNPSVGDFRHKFTRQSSCLKKCATHFSVYPA